MYLLRYIRDNKTLGLKYYDNMKDALLYELFRQYNIKTENKLMVLSGSSWKYFPETGRSIGAYIIFDQGGPIEHDTHAPGPVAQSSA